MSDASVQLVVDAFMSLLTGYAIGSVIVFAVGVVLYMKTR